MPNTTQSLSRLELAHPDLGYEGGSALHALLAAIYTKLGNNITTRIAPFSFQVASSTFDVTHNFDIPATEFTYKMYLGSAGTFAATTDFSVAGTAGNLRNSLTFTVPATGGPHSGFVLLQVKDALSVNKETIATTLHTNGLVTGAGTDKLKADQFFQLVSGALRGGAANAGAPVYSFASDPNTGMTSSVADTLLLATQGQAQIEIGPVGQVSLKRDSAVAARTGSFGSEVPFAADTATATASAVGLGDGRIFLASGTSGTPAIDAQVDTNTTNPAMLFRAKNAANAALSTNTNSLFQWNSGPTEVMRMSRDGALVVRNGVNNVNDIRHEFFGGNTSGLMRLVTSATIGNGSGNRMQFCDGNTGGTPFRSEVGVYRNAGQSQSNGYIALMPSTSTALSFYWVDAGVLRTSTTSGAMGTNGGSAVGDQTSDERLKSNIIPLNYGLEQVLELRPIRYTLNGQETIGFGAQTTQAIIPEAVYDTGDVLDASDPESPTDKLAMSYSLLIPCLTKAIQELSAKVDAQALEIAELKSRL